LPLPPRLMSSLMFLLPLGTEHAIPAFAYGAAVALHNLLWGVGQPLAGALAATGFAPSGLSADMKNPPPRVPASNRSPAKPRAEICPNGGVPNSCHVSPESLESCTMPFVATAKRPGTALSTAKTSHLPA
jgi:hypothetical protein